MKGRLFTTLGVLGIIATFIVGVTTYSSKDYLYFAPFITIGVLLGVIIMALGEIVVSLENNKKQGEIENENKKD